MSDETSARLGMPFLAGGQLQKHVTLNAALSRLDALVHLGVSSRALAVQPGDPADGEAWLLPAGATGSAWTLMEEGSVAAFQDGGWVRLDPPVGAMAFVIDEGRAVIRTGEGWVALGDVLGSVDFIDRLGVGGSADEANPLIARLNGALFTALPDADGGTGDVRLSLSKESAADVGSVVFQTAFAARAEIGLVGEDRLSIKVSPDGEVWHEGLSVDPSDGRVAFPKGTLRREATVFAAPGGYVPPTWARRIEVLLIGAGGGGGGGQGAAAGTLRMGGGGGGAGGTAQAVWPVEALAGAVTVAVGPGGAGGASGASGSSGGHSAVMLDGTPLLRAFGGGGGAPAGTGGSGGLAGRTGNAGGPSFAASAASAGAASSNPEGPGGGGGGGAVTAANVAHPGGAGGAGGVMAVSASGGTAGSAAAGGVGAAAPLVELCRSGAGGGGGGGSATGDGHAGGAGGLWGAGGGGGGGGLSVGGVGGPGAAGLVVLTAVG